jgi:hypothetical protein
MECLQQGTDMHANFRRDFFFWLGVVILPAFWSWFTLGGKHSKVARMLALGWLVLFAAIVFRTWPEMAGHYQFAVANLQFVSIAISGALFGWLAMRIAFRLGCPPVVDVILFCFLAPAIFPLVSSMGHRMLERICSQPLGQEHMLAILVPALLHLSLEPVQKGLDEST